jgi:uncharacterized protein YggU (UPF0235/DUF167 family)
MKSAYLKVKVHAEAKENRVLQKSPDGYEVFVIEPAERGRANKAVLALLAEHLGVAAGRLWIVKGAHSPAKIVAVIRKCAL